MREVKLMKSQHFYDFADLRLNLSEKILLRDGQRIPLTPKVFDTLLVLIEHAGHLIEKEDLIRQIWHDRFVEESNLTFNIKMLRKALGDNAANPRFIETVPRRGYRFIAEVRETSTEQDAIKNFAPEVSQGLQPLSKYFLTVAALLIFLLCSIVFAWQIVRTNRANAQSSGPILSAPFGSEKISNTGRVFQAVISPDGKFAAYTDQSNGKYSLWLRHLDTAENVQIVPPADEFYYGLVFAHDGQTLYFVRKPSSEQLPTSVYSVSIFGGIPVKILEKTEGWISLSPDDRQISFVRCQHHADDFCSLFVADADGKNERQILTRPSPIRIGDNQFSPDGKSIAFAAGQSANGSSDFRLMKFNLADGTESELSSQKFFNIESFKWLPINHGLLLAATEQAAQNNKIYQISDKTGAAEILTKDSTSYSTLSLDRNAEKLIATQMSDDFRLCFLPVDNPDGDVKVLASARTLTFAPDGKIVYSTSNSNGDIWTTNADGSGQRQLTSNVYKDFAPQVSPDNQFIFFTSNRTGANQIWRMNSDGSNQTRLTNTEAGYPRFVSPDGKWVYYESGLHHTLWKIATDGGGEEIQISERKIFSPAFTRDGNLVAYFFRDENLTKIAVMSIVDGKILRTFDLADEKSAPIKIAWSADGKTFSYIIGSESKNSLWEQALDKDKPRFTADLGGDKILDFTLSPDGRFLGFTRGKWIHDAVLISGLK